MQLGIDGTRLRNCPHCGNLNDSTAIKCAYCFSTMGDQFSDMIQNEERFSRLSDSECRDVYDNGIEFLTIALTRMEMQGLIRLLSKKSIYEIVRAIYNDRGLYATKERTDAKKISVKTEKKICPYCQSTVINDNNLVYCNKCGVPYHDECWQEIGGCVIFGCDSKNADTAEPVMNLSNGFIDLTDFLDNEEFPLADQLHSSDENLQPEKDDFIYWFLGILFIFIIAIAMASN